jgi:hypothetical protein
MRLWEVEKGSDGEPDTLVLGVPEIRTTTLPSANAVPSFAHEHIIAFDNSMPVAMCEDIIERFDRDPNQYQGVTISSQGEQRMHREHKSCMEVRVTDDPAWKDIDEAMAKLVRQTVADLRAYNPALKYMGDVKDDGYRIKRYNNDGIDHFGWHSDNTGSGSDTRYLVLQWYLNDVAEGGETQFRRQNIGVKPVQGRVACFPPYWTHEHRGDKPVSEPKYVISSWVMT